jgi:hypothetical protein
MADAKKMEKMKAKFAELDANGDGSLDFNELKDLLKRGNPNFTDREVKQLYDGCDANHDGRVDFNEFLNYIYQAEHSAGRTTEGRHSRMAAQSGPHHDDTEIDWGGCQHTFEAYGGKDMDGTEFKKFCKDNGLIGHGLAKTDVDLIFAKVVPKGKRRMDFNMFKDACRHIAGKRSQTNRQIQEIVAGSSGPIMHATKTDAVRFFDDKSTYTGAHAANEAHSGVNASAALGRHERVAAEADAAVHSGAAEDDWGECERVFNAFSGPPRTLEGREFKKMCDEIEGIYGSGFLKRDVDVVFASCKTKGTNHIDFAGFQECVRKIAAKKKTAPADVQQIVAASDGPIVHATKADAVRFHDDKNMYTGAHAEVHGRAGHDDGRHERLAANAERFASADEGEHDWAATEEVFALFANPDGTMDGREFLKFCVDCPLIDRKYTKNDVDVVFASAHPKGRKIDITGFKTCVRKIADKKGVPTYQVQTAVERCAGPHTHATKTDAVRFHDDKTSYTGMHVGK